jgi:hypothetical protein
MTGSVVSTSYTEVTPPPMWEQAVGGIAPLLGIAAAVLSPSAELARAVAALGAASSVVSTVTVTWTGDDLAPIKSSNSFRMKKSIKCLGIGLRLYRGMSKRFTITRLETTPPFPNGIPCLATGCRSNPNSLKAFETLSYKNFSRLSLTKLSSKHTTSFYLLPYLTIIFNSYAWVDSGAFIMYVP